MRQNKFMNGVTRTFNKVGFQIKKHSPEILLVTGVAGTVVSAVMACKATTKISGILNDTKDMVQAIHETVEDPTMADKYTEEDSKKDLAIVYTQTGLKLAKLYAPSVILGVASIGCILASNNIIHKRNAALTAAYAAVDNSFKEYRGRVVERFGQELDKELKYNIKPKKIETTVVNEDGTESVVEETVNVAYPKFGSPYARFFDDTCTAWERNAEYNLMFLHRTQDWANGLLRSKGHVFLNEVYDMLGMERSRAGQIVGWVYNEEEPNGDNYIDFGIYDLHDPEKRRFVNGKEKSILLDFNVDGNIYELLA